jgi:hypothetical protein
VDSEYGGPDEDSQHGQGGHHLYKKFGSRLCPGLFLHFALPAGGRAKGPNGKTVHSPHALAEGMMPDNWRAGYPPAEIGKGGRRAGVPCLVSYCTSAALIEFFGS